MSAIWPIQVAMVARLQANAPLQALLGNPMRLFDTIAPAGTLTPYAVIADQIGTRARTLDREGDSGTTTINIFTSGESIKQAAQIATAIQVALSTPLTVAGFGTVRMMWDQDIPLRETTGGRRRLSSRYSYFVLSETVE